MQYINDKSYEYIMSKYHDVNKPFNSFNTKIRHDEYFDESTGMNGDDLKVAIVEEDKKITHLSHPIRKAKAMAFALENTRLC